MDSMPPIFIIGNPRSGTTLLRVMMTCHPQICMAPESGWISLLAPKWAGHGTRWSASDVSEFVTELMETPKFEWWKMEREAVEDAVGGVGEGDYSDRCRAVYELYNQRNGGKPRWGDKNNFNIRNISLLAGLFPDAYFVHIVRDGRDVVCSYRDMQSLDGKYAPNLPSRFSDAAVEWSRNVAHVAAEFRRLGEGRGVTVRYESLVRQPEETLTELCESIGEDYCSEMLDFDQVNRDKVLEPLDQMAWKSRTREPLDDSSVGRWMEQLTEEELWRFDSIAGAMMREYGYSDATNAGGIAATLVRASAQSGWAGRRIKAKIFRRLGVQS